MVEVDCGVENGEVGKDKFRLRLSSSVLRYSEIAGILAGFPTQEEGKAPSCYCVRFQCARARTHAHIYRCAHA